MKTEKKQEEKKEKRCSILCWLGIPSNKFPNFVPRPVGRIIRSKNIQ